MAENNYENGGRDGFISSENNENNENTQGAVKKKRPRVGEQRTSFSSSNNERNPYQSQDRYNDQQQRGYNNRPNNYNNDGGSRNYGSQNYSNNNQGYNNRSYSNNNQEYSNNRGYNNNNQGYGNNNRSYNNNNQSYGNNNRGYNNNNQGYGNNNRGYNNNNQGYGNNNRGYNNNNQGYGNNNRGYNNNNQGYGNNNRGYNNNQGYGNNNRGYNNNNQGYGENNDYQNNYGNSYGNNNRRPQSSPRSNAPKRIIKPVKYKENIDPDTPIRLNKYLANAGVCSRREADSFITSGAVKVNGEVVNELGVKVKRGDLVTFQDKPIRLESKVYVLLNKPKNCVTTSDDPENRLTVMDLVKNACPERIYPVGRLDRNTTGVLLLTNDGDLASKLTHPKFKKKKIYQVTLDRDVAIEDMQAIADGIDLDDGEIHADSIAYQSEDALNVVGIEIHSGRNRIVRRIFEKLGYQVMRLDRVYFAGLTKKNVPKGKWRYLSETEVNMLRMGAFE